MLILGKGKKKQANGHVNVYIYSHQLKSLHGEGTLLLLCFLIF